MIDERLLIPLAELPGLDPVGLVVYGSTGTVALCMAPPYLDTIAAQHDERGMVGMHAPTVRLSLSDAATRDRCLRWLAGRVGLEVGCGAPKWEYVEFNDAWHLCDSRALYRPARWAPVLDRDGGSLGSLPAALVARCRDVPALADLDPTDDTRLSDGSRLSDALALAAVLRAQVSP